MRELAPLFFSLCAPSALSLGLGGESNLQVTQISLGQTGICRMLWRMSNPRKPMPLDDEVIDIGPPTRRRWRRWVILGAVLLIFVLLRSASIYVESLWFDSLGFASVYWYTFKLKLALFFIFAIVTFLILRGAFWLMERAFSASALERRIITVNNQAVEINPARFVRPIGWIVSLVIGFITGLVHERRVAGLCSLCKSSSYKRR